MKTSTLVNVIAIVDLAILLAVAVTLFFTFDVFGANNASAVVASTLQPVVGTGSVV